MESSCSFEKEKLATSFVLSALSATTNATIVFTPTPEAAVAAARPASAPMKRVKSRDRPAGPIVRSLPNAIWLQSKITFKKLEKQAKLTAEKADQAAKNAAKQASLPSGSGKKTDDIMSCQPCGP